jgi:hypothetical protein
VIHANLASLHQLERASSDGSTIEERLTTLGGKTERAAAYLDGAVPESRYRSWTIPLNTLIRASDPPRQSGANAVNGLL